MQIFKMQVTLQTNARECFYFFPKKMTSNILTYLHTKWSIFELKPPLDGKFGSKENANTQNAGNPSDKCKRVFLFFP
jgi:hypothetical protein